MSANASIVIVGAGIAGLTAAYQLKQAGHEVLVLESQHHVGGRMTTVDWEGFKVDIGAKFVTTSDTSLLKLVRELGIDDQLAETEEGLTITIFRDGSLHSANFLSIPSYLRWSGVSLGARLAMGKLVRHFWAMRKIDDVYHLERAPGPDTDETFQEFFYKHISEEMFEYWAIPMFETMCAYSGEDVSRKAFLAMMVGYLNADSITFHEGVGVLPQALSSQLAVELNARVHDIRTLSDGSGARISYMQNGVQRTLIAQVVVVAIPGNRVLGLFDESRPAWQRFFPKVGYSTGALHYHIVETDYQPQVKGTFVPRSTKLPINSVAFEAYKDGRWLMLTDPSIYSFDMSKPESQLVQEAVDTASKIFPAIKGRFVAHRIFRWEDKVPTFRPGYLDALAAFWNDPQEGPVFFCGDYFAGPSAGGALFTGRECAGRVLISL